MPIQIVGGLHVENTQLGDYCILLGYLHTNVLEITVSYFAVKMYAVTLSETLINLRVDNTETLAWINKQTAPNETVHLLLKEFWEF